MQREHLAAGIPGLVLGASAEEAALFAIVKKAGIISNNPKGGNMYLPKEVRDWIEREERTVKPRVGRFRKYFKQCNGKKSRRGQIR